ncbi:hypothetical protein [Oleisolibacter albus]|uniref:hypothetical protein n=1 Tax=Oleisolibacter albus TaxID=2171757 RepID=UPI001EFCFC17|nr:hypothetical protein [Oleisolibacter albus]
MPPLTAAPMRPTTGPVARFALLSLALFPLLAGLLSLALGQDANWDLRNYHWYNAYAWWTGRGDLDVAPAQVATFYNPTLDLPFYLLAQALPARAVGFLMGAVQGLNVLPLFGLSWALLAGLEPTRRSAAALALALIGFFGGGQLGLLGTTFYDNVISLFVLGSAWVVLARAAVIWGGPSAVSGPAFAAVALAGLLVGSAVGLKQPTLPYAVGLCFAFLVVGGGFWRRVLLSFFFGLGVIAGMALFSGHWMWHLWTEYRNPLFPYFNHIFKSPWGVPEAYRDDKFIPPGLIQALLFPFAWVLNPKLVGEILFRDLRVPVAYVVLLATPLLLLWGRIKGRRPDPALPARRPALYLLVAGALTYLVWLKLFSIYRYLIPLEMLAPVLIVAAVMLWPLPGKARTAIALTLLLLVSVTIRPGNWHRIDWTDRFVAVDIPPIPDPDHTIILQTGYAPTAFLISGFPPQIPFYRIHSYFIHPDQKDILLNRRMAERIAAHQGDIYVLLAHWEEWTDQHILPYYGLKADLMACKPVTSTLDEPMKLCPVRRETRTLSPG